MERGRLCVRIAQYAWNWCLLQDREMDRRDPSSGGNTGLQIAS